MRRILIIEDDPQIRRHLKDVFQHDGYEVRAAADGEEGLSIARVYRPDAIVLDWLLPKMNGDEVLEALQQERIPSMVLMLTVRDSDQFVVKGLRKGADDYVAKPFSDLVLLERVRALLRRQSPRDKLPDTLSFDDVTVNFLSCEAHRAGAPIPMRPKEFAVLRYLASRPGEVIGRNELLRNVWGRNRGDTDRAVDNVIATLRRKLERNPKVPLRLRSVPGVGYSFVRDLDKS